MKLILTILPYIAAHYEFGKPPRTTAEPDPDDDGHKNFPKLYNDIKKRIEKIDTDLPGFLDINVHSVDITTNDLKKLRKQLQKVYEIIDQENTYGDATDPPPYEGQTQWEFLTGQFVQIQKGQIAGYVYNSEHYELSFKLKVGDNLPIISELTSVIQVGNNTESDRFPALYLKPGYKNFFKIYQTKSHKFLDYKHEDPQQWQRGFKVPSLSANTVFDVKIRKSDHAIRVSFDDVEVGKLNCYGVPAMEYPGEQPIRIGVDADHEVDYPSAGHFEIGDIVYKRIEKDAPVPTSDSHLMMARVARGPVQTKRHHPNWIDFGKFFG